MSSALRIICFLRFYLLLIVGFAGVDLWAVPAKTIRNKNDLLLKEVRDLTGVIKKAQETMGKVQDRLSEIIGQIEPIKPAPEALPPTVSNSKVKSFILQHIDQLNQYLRKRAQEFFDGGMEVIHGFWMVPSLSPSFISHLLAVISSLAIGFILVGIGQIFLRKRIAYLLQNSKTKHLHQLAYLTAFLFLPLGIYCIFSSINGFFLSYFGVPISQNWYLNHCALLPFHLYTFWAGNYWILLALAPTRPSQAFILMDPYGAHRVASGLRKALLFYLIATLFLGTAEMVLITTTMVHTILDFFFSLVVFFVLRALLIARSSLIPSKAMSKVMRKLNVARALVISTFVIWVIGRQFLMHFLSPLLVTGFVFLLLAPIHKWVREFRIQWLWRRRHQSFFLKPVFASKTTLLRLVDGLLYAGLLFVWMPYLWGDATFFWVQGLFSSPSVIKFFSNLFNATLIFFGAVFLVKGVERILQYYVEEKYTTDSLENNFLASRLKTLMAMLKTSLRILIWIPAISIIVSQFGELNISAWMTSIGAASFGLTFGFQNIVRDFIAGFFILLENNLMVGDEVDVDQRVGKVEEITLRTLRIRGDNGMLLTIPFGNIVVIGNKNRKYSAIVLNISIGYREDLERVQLLVERAFSLLKRLPLFNRRILGPLEVRGVNEVTSYSVIFQVKIKTAPNSQDMVRRAFTRQLKQVFDEAGIVVPTSPHTVLKAAPSLTHTVL